MKFTDATEWLFLNLYKKNPATKSSCELVNIPDTIIYKWAKPYYWFHTIKNKIKRKKKEKIYDKEIISEFKSTNDTLSSNYYKPIQNDSSEETVEVEYFTNERLENFIYNRDKSSLSILQK